MVRMPPQQLSGIEELAPLSATLARYAARERAKRQDDYAAQGSQAFDKVETEARKALQKNQQEWIKAVQAGITPELSSPEAIKSYWTDAGAQLAVYAAMQAEEKRGDLTEVTENGMLRASRATPDQIYMAAAEALENSFGAIDVSELPQAAQTAYVAHRQRVEQEWIPNIVAEGVNNATKFNDQLKTTKYRGQIDTVFEASAFTEESAESLASLVEQDYSKGFTSSESPGKARIAFFNASIGALEQFRKADQPEQGLEALDFIRSLNIGGAIMGDDPRFAETFEDLEDEFQVATESNPEARANKAYGDKAQLASDQAWEEYSPRLLSVEGSYQRQAEIDSILREVSNSGKYGDVNGAVVETLNRRLKAFVRDPVEVDPKKIDSFRRRIRQADNREDLQLLRTELDSMLDAEAVSPEQYDTMLTKIQGRLSPDKTRRSTAYKRLQEDLTPAEGQFHLSVLPRDARGKFQEELEKIQDAAARQLEARDIEADQSSDPEQFLDDARNEILVDARKSLSDLLEQYESTQDYKADLNAGWERGMDQTERISQLRRDGRISDEQALKLIQENTKKADWETRFFYPGSPAQQASSAVVEGLLASEAGQDLLLEWNADMTRQTLTEQGHLVKPMLEQRVRERILERMEAELPSVALTGVRTAVRDIAREVQMEFLKDIFPAEAQRGAESDLDAESLEEMSQQVGSATSEFAKALQGFSDAARPALAAGLVDLTENGLAAQTEDPTGFFSGADTMWQRETDYWRNLRDYLGSAKGSYKGEQMLDRAQWAHARRIMQLDDASPESKRMAVLEMYRHRGLTPGNILKGEFTVSIPFSRFVELTELYVTPRIAEEKKASGDSFVISFDPTTEINPYEVPIWPSVTALEQDLVEDPEFVKKVLLSTGGIAEEELQQVIEAQRRTIQFHYRR